MAYLSEITLADFQRRHPKLATAANAVAATVQSRGDNIRGDALYSENLLLTASHVSAAEAVIKSAGVAIRAHPYFRHEQYSRALDGGLVVPGHNAGSASSQAGPANAQT